MPSISDVAICNMALAMLKVGAITSIGSENEQSRICELFYDRAKDYVLASHPWNFAVARAELTELVSVPLYEYDILYQLPADCLRILSLEDEEDDYTWEREGDKLLTDKSSPINMRYISRVTDPTKFTPCFIIALATYLAYLMASTLTNDMSTMPALYQAYEITLRQAKAADSLEGRQKQQFVRSTWVESRS